MIYFFVVFFYIYTQGKTEKHVWVNRLRGCLGGATKAAAEEEEEGEDEEEEELLLCWERDEK